MATNLQGATPAEAVADLGLDRASHAVAERDSEFVAGDVQIRLVEGEGLDQVRVLVEDLPDLPGDLPVSAEVRGCPDRLGAQPQCRSHRHGRAHPEGTGLVRGRGDHASPFGIAADYDGPSPEARVVPLLHGGVERVHVDVNDLAAAAHRPGPSGRQSGSNGRPLTTAAAPSTDRCIPGRQ